MYEFSMTGRRMAMFVCRGYATEIGNKAAFKKCPVCGIKWG